MCVGASAATASASRISTGPFVLGSTLDEVSRAAPELGWAALEHEPFTGRVTAIKSTQPILLGGVSFDEVRAEAGFYQSALRFTARAAAANAEACESRVLDFLSSMEPETGPLRGRAVEFFQFFLALKPSADDVLIAVRGAGGNWELEDPFSFSPFRQSANSQDMITYGAASSAFVRGFDRDNRPQPRRSFAKRPPQLMVVNASRMIRLPVFDSGLVDEGPVAMLRDVAAEGRIRIDAVGVYDAGEGGVCRLALDLEQRMRPPDPIPVAIDKAPMRLRISIPERHAILASAPSLPETPIDVPVVCAIDRFTGNASACAGHPDGNIPGPWREAAAAIAAYAEFDLGYLASDEDPRPRPATFSIRIDPADLRPLDFAQRPRTDVSAIGFTRTASAMDMERVYPNEALRSGIEGQALAICEVQSDATLLCIGRGAPPGQFEAAFNVAAARVLMEAHRVAPTLRNGEPSAGAVFEIPVVFKLER